MIASPWIFTIPCPFGDDEACGNTLTITVTPWRPALHHASGWDPPEPAELEVHGCPHVDEVSDEEYAKIELSLWDIVRQREEDARAVQADRWEYTKG